MSRYVAALVWAASEAISSSSSAVRGLAGEALGVQFPVAFVGHAGPF